MGFLMYVKHVGGAKLPLPPQSNIFKSEAKKKKLTSKLENIQNFLKFKWWRHQFLNSEFAIGLPWLCESTIKN